MAEKKTNDNAEVKKTTAKSAEKKVSASSKKEEPKFKNTKKSEGTVTVKSKSEKKKDSGFKIFLKILLVIIIIIIALGIAHGFRNYFTLVTLHDKVSQYTDSTNYSEHIESIDDSSNSKITIDYYKKNTREAAILTREVNGQKVIISTYKNGSRVDIFTDTGTSKKAKLNQNTSNINISILDLFANQSKFQIYMSGMFTSISEEDYKDTRVCKISNLANANVLDTEGGITYYIDKDTGLIVKTEQENITSERSYNFDSVDNSVFLEPDIGEYSIEK